MQLFNVDFRTFPGDTSDLLPIYGLFIINSKAFYTCWSFRSVSSDTNFNDIDIPDFFKNLLNLRNKPYLVWSYKEYKLNNKLLGNNAGIYAFYSINSGRFYVCSAQNLIFRINQHLKNPLRSNKPLQGAFKKYGKDSFKIIIFEVIDANSLNLKTVLMNAENYFLKIIPKPLLYNINLQAYTSKGFKHSAKSKILMALNAKGRVVPLAVRQTISDSLKGSKNHFFGKTHDTATRKRIALAVNNYYANLDAKSRVFSPEFLYQQKRDKTGANNPRAKAVIVTNKNTNQVSEFPTITAAAKFINGDRKSVGLACKNNKLFKGTWLITYKK